MAAKKSKKKEVPAEEKPEGVFVKADAPSNGLYFDIQGPVYPDGCLHFSPNDLIRYELLQERVQSILQQIGMNILEKEKTASNANKEIERIRTEATSKIAELESTRVGLVSTGKSREEELRKFQEGLGVAYNGLDLTKVSYDSMSGKIFVLDGGELLPVPEPSK